MNTNLVKLDNQLALSQQDNIGAEITKQVGNVMGALQKFEEETEAKAIKNAENLEVDAIGVDLLPEAGKEFMYTEFNRIGEELAEAENRKDRKAVRDLKLEGANLIKAQNTIGQMLKDHAEDLLGVDGEGSYSGGSDKTMMNMLINKEYTIRKEGKDMVIDFTGPNGKKGIKLEDLDEHIYLKKNDLAVNYDKAITGVRNAANKGMPFDKNSFARVVKQTLNTTQKLVASMWDDNFTLKDGQTLKDLWQEENPNLDANQYLRTSGDEWDENAVREFANKKLMQGGINDAESYKKKEKIEEEEGIIGDDGFPKNFPEYVKFRNNGVQETMSKGVAKTLWLGLNDGIIESPIDNTEYRYLDGVDGTGWYTDVNGTDVKEYETTNDLVSDFGIQDIAFRNLEPNIVKGNTVNKDTVDDKYKTGATYEIMNNGDREVASKLNKLIFPQNDERNPRGLYFDTKNLIQQEIQLFDKANKPVIINGRRVTYSTSKKASMDTKSKTFKDILDMLNDQKLLKSVEYDNKVNSDPNVKYTYRDGSEVNDETVNLIEKKKKFKFKNKGFNFKSE